METYFDEMERTTTGQAWDRVADDLRNLASDAEELLKATASDASERAQTARMRLSNALERAKGTCQDLEERSVAVAKSMAQKTDRLIRQHPYESLGTVLGVGILIGVLISRS